MPESSNRQEVLRQIHIFISIELKELSCDCMVIGTTRPQGYNNDFDETKYKHLVVAELSKKDCHMYIQKLFELMEEQTEQREDYIRIMKEALEDEITCRLMKTPLQITIISILVKSGGKPPHERYSLFRQYCDTIIRREKQKEIVATLNDNTGWLEDIHYIIGDRLQCESERAGNPSAEISKGNLNKAIKAYVDENHDNFYESKSGIEKKVEEFLMTITERICFLCENRDGYYSFNIRSIQEYFAGTYLIKDRTDREAINNIKQIAYSSYWRNALLFALGYIELERKSLEPEIGKLCEQMNGRDNIMKSDYSIENLCLFGSWLAVDILAEDIFRGKQQDKYVVLATKVLELAECDSFKNFNNFSLITGAQRDKLLRFIKENYFEKGEFLEKILMMYLKLNENTKNNLNTEIIEMAEGFSEEQQLMFAIYILENNLSSSEDINQTAKCQIIHALGQDKIKFFLSYLVLDELLDIVDIDTNTILKKNLFLQYLFCDEIIMLQRGFDGKLGAVMKTAISCFAPIYPFDDRNHIEIRISEAIEICVRDEEANKKKLEELWVELQQMGLDYLADFCRFLLEPSFEKYQRLYDLLDKQEEYLRNRYKSILQEYVGDVVLGTEKKFNKWVSTREEEYKKIVKGDVKELQFGEMKVKFTYFIHGDCIMDELIESYSICIEELCRLNKQFFEVYMFVAEVYVKHMQQVSEMSEKTAQCIIDIIYDANCRRYYDRRMFEMIGILLASKYKKKLWEKVPDFALAEQMIQQELLQYTEISWFVECIGEEEQQNIISNIVNKLTYDEKENSYLSIIPLLIRSKIDLRNCISENDMKKLDQIECVINTNILSIKLLQMCMVKNDDPHKLIEEILTINMPHKAIFMELENMLRYCRIDNKEKIWVVVYQRLVEEDFEGCQKIRDRIINDMIEAKCNAVTR